MILIPKATQEYVICLSLDIATIIHIYINRNEFNNILVFFLAYAIIYHYTIVGKKKHAMIHFGAFLFYQVDIFFE